MRVALVGCGGIGWHLAEPVARTLNIDAQTEEHTLFLVDGDSVEAGNMERQYFQGAIGKGKAHVLAERLGSMFPDVEFNPVGAFINPETLGFHRNIWFSSGITILAGVDNNASRAFLEDEAAKVKSAVLVLGGNDETSGQASMYVRRNGRELSPRITDWTPELRQTDGKMPGMGTCQRSGSIQSATANRAAALCMELLWDHARRYPALRFNEARFNLREMIMKGFWMDPFGKFKKEVKEEEAMVR